MSSPAIATPWSPQDPKSETFARVGACETPEQLDCIESIGAYINGELVNGALTDRFEDPGSELTDGVWVPIERSEASPMRTVLLLFDRMAPWWARTRANRNANR